MQIDKILSILNELTARIAILSTKIDEILEEVKG